MSKTPKKPPRAFDKVESAMTIDAAIRLAKLNPHATYAELERKMPKVRPW